MGSTSEIEFATILRWLGTCRFVHRLNEEVLADKQTSQWQVPDLFAVFTAGPLRCCVLIEVKTTEETVLNFRKSYLDHLKAYPDPHKHPLLVAWRPRKIGFWILIDPSIAEIVDEENIEIYLSRAMQNDLMSVLAGDFYVTPKPGTGFRIEAKRITEKTPTEDGYEAVFQNDKAYFHDANGSPVRELPNSIVSMIFSAAQYEDEVSEDRVMQFYSVPEGMTRAQSTCAVPWHSMWKREKEFTGAKSAKISTTFCDMKICCPKPVRNSGLSSATSFCSSQ